MGVINQRDYCYDAFGNYVNCYSTWNNWGRWVAFAVIVGSAFVFFFLFACLNARRRRARGQTPMYGTHWMAPPPYRQGDYQPAPPPQYQRQDPGQGFYAPPQQPYSPPQGAPGPYSGQQENGIELQQPPTAYHGGEQVYAPPPGPPPAKK
ncbi:hypothetical protein TMatcc_005548 [Talaromyces marneffei ATCC 18224]|uniref:Chitin synthesis regulation, Congo red resistance, RCR protein n=2 Tax=Talaromyces marneffei TaxID=37727 RepID=B6QA35_TALMQ|nr:uncharacterized protein EYB26_005920 [Talaromyces marneffei]EEA26199.1 conserved hypothetical protein [Talaromyces marneffei ATCC 18224]KAE8554896.1 hypothetical protein EYB25_003443 [Talaromyces marneffei]QGA18236.1 hypothetical protein EYB26_005920 [Talaromyces marneffei]